MTFDPIKETRFRGKSIPELTREEMQDALVQALKEVHRLRTTAGEPLDASGSYMGTGSAYWNPNLAGR